MRKFMKSVWTLGLVGLLVVAADLAVRAAGASMEPVASGESGFRELSERVRGLFKSAAENRIEARQENERVKKDLLYISEELDRETLGEEENRPLQEYANGMLARLD